VNKNENTHIHTIPANKTPARPRRCVRTSGVRVWCGRDGMVDVCVRI